MFLVDSTFYIDILRARQDPVEVLRPWLVREQILSCGVVRCEVLRGVINKRVQERIRDLFDALNSIDIDDTLWDEAAHLAWTLDRRGKVLPLTDLLIACCALRAKATIVSSDEHFRGIQDLSVAAALPR